MGNCIFCKEPIRLGMHEGVKLWLSQTDIANENKWIPHTCEHIKEE